MQALSDDMDYYVVRTAPMREETVTRIVEGRRIADAAFYMPRWVRASRYHRKLVESKDPALTGYVFLGFRRDPNWFAVRNASHAIVGVLGVQNTPERVVYRQLLRFMAPQLFPSKRDTAEDIRRLVALAAERERASRREILSGRVRMTSGPWCGIEGFVENATENHAVVRLGILGGRSVTIKVEHLQQLDRAKNAA